MKSELQVTHYAWQSHCSGCREIRLVTVIQNGAGTVKLSLCEQCRRDLVEQLHKPRGV